MLILRNIYAFYSKLFVENLDPRTKDYPLLGSPFTVAILIGSYLYFVNVCGPSWMKRRNAFDLNKIINVYNTLQIVMNSYVFYVTATGSHLQDNFDVWCIPDLRHDFSPFANKLVRVSYFFYLVKVIDLMDTVFFVLRKKFNQVSFLHMYHHTAMVTATYAYLKFYSGGGPATVLACVNSFVHVVMYGYYFLTSYSPALKSSIWWKKYITQMQLVQFWLLGLYYFVSIYCYKCDTPTAVVWIGYIQAFIIIALFGEFYYKAYVKQRNVNFPACVAR